MRFALVEAVIRDDAIDCPYCRAAAPVTYAPRQRVAVCPGCSSQMQVTEILPTNIGNETYWGVQGMRQLSRWLLVAWRQPLFAVPEMFQCDPRFADLTCRCGEIITPYSAAHLVGNVGAEIQCPRCFEAKLHVFDLWDGKWSVGDPLARLNEEGYRAAAQLRKRLKYIPFGRTPMLSRGATICPFCKLQQNVDKSLQGKLTQCVGCRATFPVRP